MDVVEKDLVGVDGSGVGGEVVSGMGFIGGGRIMVLEKEVVGGVSRGGGVWSRGGMGVGVGWGM